MQALAASLQSEQWAGVSDERYSTAQLEWDGPQMLADALLRSVAGTSALLRVTGTNTDTSQSEAGLVATTFAEVAVSPVVIRTLRPSWKEGGESKWELLVSATGVQQQVNALDLGSAQSLFTR